LIERVSLAPTDKRKVVKLLLRFAAGSEHAREGARLELEGYEVIVLGQSKAKDWPNATVLPGDFDGMCWTMERQVVSVARNLRALPEVIDVKGD
jgi:hypothetical protein